MARFSKLAWLIASIWIVFVVDRALGLRLDRFGIQPRDPDGLIGILVWPFLHGNFAHISSNTVSLALFGGIISARSDRTFWKLTIYSSLVAGACLWVVGRDAIHIGASGLVFSYFGYIVMRGFYDKSFVSLTIAGIVMILFGSLIWGVLPSDPRISWEGHLLGLVAGALFASKTGRKGYRS